MPRNVRYRYFLNLNIKSTTKAELVEELEELIEYVKESNTFGMTYGGNSGTCFVDGELKMPCPYKTHS